MTNSDDFHVLMNTHKSRESQIPHRSADVLSSNQQHVLKREEASRSKNGLKKYVKKSKSRSIIVF